MRQAPQRVRTRNVRDITVNTRVTRDIRDRARAAAMALGCVPADIYRDAFAFYLDALDAAGGRELSEIERQAALSAIRLARSKIAETVAQYAAVQK